MQATQLAALRAEIDPNNTYGTQKLLAALKALGLEPDDVDPTRAGNDITVHPDVPAENAKMIKAQRAAIWESLRQSRLQELRNTLEGLQPKDVRRYERAGHGVRAVQPGDIPDVGEIAGMGDFEDMVARTNAKNVAEQQKKADILGRGFLTEKLRQEQADAKIDALEKRLKEYKKTQEENLKAKQTELEKNAEKRKQNVRKAAQARAEWADETLKRIEEKEEAARRKRKEMYSKEALKTNFEDSEQRRHGAFRMAADLEADMQERLETKRQDVEARLEERRQQVAAETERRAEAMQAKFQRRQVAICAMNQEWADNKLAEHSIFMEKVRNGREGARQLHKEKAKSTGDLQRKAADKVRGLNNKLMASRQEEHAALLARHREADDRRDALQAAKFKMGNDVHSFREVKSGTWGALHTKREAELRNSRDAHTQALVFEIAENYAKMQARSAGCDEVQRRRKAIGKESLTFADKAREGFLKIQSEPDERKVVQMMNDLGFNMPTLPAEEPEAEAEEAGRSY